MAPSHYGQLLITAPPGYRYMRFRSDANCAIQTAHNYDACQMFFLGRMRTKRNMSMPLRKNLNTGQQEPCLSGIISARFSPFESDHSQDGEN